jgi:hypothetical protein
MKEHPHGGPPGQLKKQLGLQTGAEVVHGEKRARSVVVVPQQQAPVVLEPRKEKKHDHKAQQAPMISSVPPPAPAPVVVAPAGGKGKDNGNQGDQGKGGGKGKGKGHGKD